MPTSLQMAIPALLESAVLRMLAKRPRDRFATPLVSSNELERVAKYQGEDNLLKLLVFCTHFFARFYVFVPIPITRSKEAKFTMSVTRRGTLTMTKNRCTRSGSEADSTSEFTKSRSRNSNA